LRETIAAKDFSWYVVGEEGVQEGEVQTGGWLKVNPCGI
jgi:hypothetical protein